MDPKKLERVKEHLQKPEVKLRIQKYMLDGHDNATVTISRAAELSGISVNQLRDWEKKGLLKPLRTEAFESKSIQGQRQYSISELDKLAIIRELTNANFPPGAIPTNIDEIWFSILEADQQGTIIDLDKVEQKKFIGPSSNNDKFLPINVRADSAYVDHYSWRFYASHALQLTLLLASEGISGTYMGLILPASESYPDNFLLDTYNLPTLGESLIGWLGRTHSFNTLLTHAPSFEYPSDFRIIPLSENGVNERLTELKEDRTLIFVQRDEVKKLNLTKHIVETAQSLLRLLYEDKKYWQKYFGQGMQDLFQPGVDFTPQPDLVLEKLANIVVRLGGKYKDGSDRWRFCCVLLPENQHLPLQQRSLVVRAMSKNVHYVIGLTRLSPERYRASLSLRAFQSGHVIYRQELSAEEITAQTREIEGPVRSNIAVPIGGEMGEPLGVLYIASYKTNAFSEQDYRILRIMSKMIEELLKGYVVRKSIARDLINLIRDPEVIDPSFGEFKSENDFIQDIEEFLKTIKARIPRKNERKIETIAPIDLIIRPMSEEISFIAIDIDNQDHIARDYGEQMLRNLQKTIGQRIQDLLPALFSRHVYCELYHIYAGRFYLFLRGFSLDVSKRNAERLKKHLEKNVVIKPPDVFGSSLIISDVNIHLAVTWYSYEKLAEFLEMEQYSTVADVSSILYRTLDSVLKLGMDEGGDVIYAWNPASLTFTVYQPYDVDA
jgi:MerR HTH family regulatory protein